MPKKPFDTLTESMFYVLLAFRCGSKCGTDVALFIEQTTRGRLRIGPATLYTLLGKFESEKMIREIEVDGRRRTYEITPRGAKLFDEELSRLKACIADASALL